MPQPLRWALVGASDIAATKVLPAIRAVGDTRRRGPLRQRASTPPAGPPSTACPRRSPTCAAAVERDDVDAVYVSSVNALHREHVEAAAAAGKHVLAEKPLALSLEDARGHGRGLSSRPAW